MQAIPMLGMGAQLAGVGAGTVGNVMSADVNAKIQDIQARTIADNAAFDERQFRRKATLAAGSNVATAAASGIDITRGSPLFAELDFARQSEIEAQSIRRSGRIGAENARFGARMIRRQIPFTIAEGVLSAFGERGPGTSILNRLAGSR